MLAYNMEAAFSCEDDLSFIFRHNANDSVLGALRAADEFRVAPFAVGENDVVAGLRVLHGRVELGDVFDQRFFGERRGAPERQDERRKSCHDRNSWPSMKTCFTFRPRS